MTSPSPGDAAAQLWRYLQIRTAHGAVYAAGGRRVAFLTDVTGVPQLWSVPAEGGWPDQLTFADDRVQQVVGAPRDGDLLVFGRDHGGDERTQLHAVRPDGVGERPLVVDDDVIHRLGVAHPAGDGLLYCANARNGIDFDLYLRGLRSDERRLVAELDGSNTVVDVSPDGRLALLAHARSSMDGQARIVDLSSGALEVLTAHGRPARVLPAAFSDDGTGLFLRSDLDGDFLRAYRVDLGAHTWTAFGPAGWDVEGLEVRAGTGALSVNEDGRSRLCLFDPGSLEVGAGADLPAGVVGDLCLRADGRRLLCTVSAPSRPADVWQVDVGSGQARRLTRSSTAGLDPRGFVEPDVVRVTSFDGLEVPAWVYLPRSPQARPPVVVSVHGGPEAQERPRFQPLYQYLLARGFAVVAPNVRGSTGYGRRYAALDDRERRPDAVADLVAVGQWVRTRPDLDGERMAVMGGSYGGYMVLCALTSAPDLWRAGVDIVGVVNLVTFLERTGPYRRHLREAEYGSLAHDRDLLTRLSPVHQVERIRAPLLVVHGANDPRVPLAEAEQVVARLEALGRQVEAIVFDDEGHGIVRLGNRMTAYGAISAFLERHLR